MLAGTQEYTALTVQTPLPPRARAALGKAWWSSTTKSRGKKSWRPWKSTSRATTSIQAPDQGRPGWETIAKVAEAGEFDMIIMGTQGHGALGKLIMGSVSTQVLASCHVPVLLVR